MENRVTKEKTVTVDTNAFADGDYVGSVITIEGMCRGGASAAVLEKITILDKDAQGVALDLLFFDESPTVASAENAALNISDTEMEKCIGGVSIVAADYHSTSANSIATKVISPGLPLKPDSSETVYCVIKSRGTPTYAGAALTLRFTFKI